MAVCESMTGACEPGATNWEQPVSARATAHPTMAAIRPVRFLGITVVKATPTWRKNAWLSRTSSHLTRPLRIVLLDSGKDRIRFQYNPASKPVVIAVEGVGEIHVTSDDKEEIQQVESPEGRKVALE